MKINGFDNIAKKNNEIQCKCRGEVGAVISIIRLLFTIANLNEQIFGTSLARIERHWDIHRDDPSLFGIVLFIAGEIPDCWSVRLAIVNN